MKDQKLVVLGIAIIVGLSSLGYFLRDAAISFKQFERTVTVRGLAEQEHPADVVIWPIQFTEAGKTLDGTYTALEQSAEKVRSFLVNQDISEEELSFSTPVLTDLSAQRYGSNTNPEFRYIATYTATLYSENVDLIRDVMSRLVDLGKQGVTLNGDEYSVRPEYIFNRLNEIKPVMLESGAPLLPRSIITPALSLKSVGKQSSDFIVLTYTVEKE